MSANQMCATCVFRRNGLKRPAGRLDEIRRNQIAGHRHVCHSMGLELDGSVAGYCRGAECYAARKAKGGRP